MNKEMIKLLLYWIRERQKIFEKKEAGKKWPWTKDEILQSYRFCNVYREQDTETIWIHKHWLMPNKYGQDDPDAWFAMCVARFINWHTTLDKIGYPVPWRPAKVLSKMRAMKAQGLKVFTGASTPVYTGAVPVKSSIFISGASGTVIG